MAKSNIRTLLVITVVSGVFALVAAIISSPHWFKYFFPEQYVEQEKIRPEMSSDGPQDSGELKGDLGVDTIETGTEHIVIDRLELCPVNSSIPSYFFLTVKNRGTKTLENLRVTIDFGRAEYQQSDFFFSSDNQKLAVDTTNKNMISVTLRRLCENESYSVYCLLSQPVFRTIKINGDNLKYAKEYSYSNFIQSEIDQRQNLLGFLDFLIVMVSLILVVLSIYFLIAVYQFLRSKGIVP